MKKVLLFLILMICLSLFSDITMVNNRLYEVQNINVMYPTYFDPNHPESQPIIFEITMTEEAIGEIPDNYYFIFNMSWRGNDLLSEGKINVDASSFPDMQFTFTNREMITDDVSIFNADFDWEDILTENDDFEQHILSTGRMPDGEYVLSLSAFFESGEQMMAANTVTSIINITSPSAILLISPGTPLGLGSMSIHDMYPTFVWYSDMEKYTVKLYELTDEYITQEEIEYLEPIMVEHDYIGTNLPFPSNYAGLSENKIYAWQVTATINYPVTVSQHNPTGDETYLKSDVYIFNTFTDNVTDMDTQVLLNFLYQLNLSGIDDIIRLLESGYGFDTIVWDGREVRLEELREILEKYLAGEINVKSLSVE